MGFSEKEVEEIRKQLANYHHDSPIEQLAIGFVDEMDGDLCEIKLKNPKEEIMTIYTSRKFIEQKGLDTGANKFLALVEYTSIYGQKLEIVRISKPKKR